MDLEREHRLIAEAVIARYTDSASDQSLTERSADEIEKAWQILWTPGNGPRYYRFVNPEMEGADYISDPRVEPFSPEGDGYTFCPVRITEREGMGDQKMHTEITGSLYAKTTMEAIKKAKRVANHSASSWVRSLVKAEVLLSGPLKFDRQTKPIWFPFRLRTVEEWAEIYRQGMEFLREQGYEFK